MSEEALSPEDAKALLRDVGALARSICPDATPDDIERAVHIVESGARATPARPLRVRLYFDRLEGPPWLGLLAQCAWLRGGILAA